MSEHRSPEPLFLTKNVRLWMYAVGIAVLSVLGVYGILDGEKIYAFNFLLATFFGVAAQNVDRGTPAA